MIRTALLAASFALVASPSLADAAADRTTFETMVEACVAENGTTDALVLACMEEKQGAADAEMATALDALAASEPDHAVALRAAQVTWEAYRLTQCNYHAEVRPRDANPRRLFCAMRLGQQRLSQLREGLDFADYEAR
jgi:uncharacterized protein YecT (DUF1311 family)